MLQNWAKPFYYEDKSCERVLSVFTEAFPLSGVLPFKGVILLL